MLVVRKHSNESHPVTGRLVFDAAQTLHLLTLRLFSMFKVSDPEIRLNCPKSRENSFGLEMHQN